MTHAPSRADTLPGMALELLRITTQAWSPGPRRDTRCWAAALALAKGSPAIDPDLSMTKARLTGGRGAAPSSWAGALRRTRKSTEPGLLAASAR